MSIEDRLTRLEHREAITELRAEYCYRIDARDWDGYAALFAEDAHLDFGPVGTYTGRDQVRNFAENVVGEQHSFLAHMVHNPIIEISGKTATGKWYFEVPCTLNDGSAGWIQGIYNDEYRLIDGEWLFSEVVADFNYFAEYKEGWAEIVADN
ncbi:nuclear transport factor 2 family protein [Natronorubrum sp. FCH18a]|uniref:nuclear transport factor 2 family protein n=1 Tax=Natronorubrum sp. FCH18a TaxID=3447018 RepID=UPI003F514F77